MGGFAASASSGLTTGLPKLSTGSVMTVSLVAGELIYSHNGKEVYRSVLPDRPAGKCKRRQRWGDPSNSAEEGEIHPNKAKCDAAGDCEWVLLTEWDYGHPKCTNCDAVGSILPVSCWCGTNANDPNCSQCKCPDCGGTGIGKFRLTVTLKMRKSPSSELPLSLYHRIE